MRTPDTRALRERARELRIEADQLIRKAEADETRNQDEMEIASRKRTIRDAARAANAGFEDSYIIARLVSTLGLATSDARATLETERRTQRRSDHARRNREILRLARRGWTNAELGKKFNLSEKHVSRLVGDALGRILANAPYYTRGEHIAGKRLPESRAVGEKTKWIEKAPSDL